MEKILVAPSSFYEQSLEPIINAGFQVVLNPFGRKLTMKEVKTFGKDCIGIIAGVEPLNYEVIEFLSSSLECISRCGSGMENVDLDAASRLGIVVKSTPDAPTRAVAELTIGLIFSLLRDIPYHDRNIHNMVWEKKCGSLLSGKKVGIIGLGRIGLKVAEMLKALEVVVVGTDIKPKLMGSTLFDLLPLDELLKVSDIVTVHISSNNCVIGERELSLMKNGSYLINTSRGTAIDTKALFASLTSKHLAGVALDVFDNEPYEGGDLIEFDNVILTPHIGSYAKETRLKMELEAVNNLIAGIENV